MGFLRVNNEEVRASDSGMVSIPESQLIHSSIPEVDKVLTGEYTRMVQENPEYDFAIVRDNTKIKISWKRRE